MFYAKPSFGNINPIYYHQPPSFYGNCSQQQMPANPLQQNFSRYCSQQQMPANPLQQNFSRYCSQQQMPDNPLQQNFPLYCSQQQMLVNSLNGSRVMAIVVDGYNFALKTGFLVKALEKLIQDIKKHSKLGEQVRVAALHLFFPDQNDALFKGIIDEKKFKINNAYLMLAKINGWEVHHSGFKRVRNHYQASLEDTKFYDMCIRLSERGSLPPYGSNPEPVSPTDIVVVSSDKDHLNTLKQLERRGVLGWCVVPQGSRFKDLERWGKSSGRLLKVPMVKEKVITKPPPNTTEHTPSVPGQLKNGIVVKWNVIKKIGFIKPDEGGKDIYFYYGSVTLKEDLDKISVGDRFSFDVGVNKKGPVAVNMKSFQPPKKMRSSSAPRTQSEYNTKLPKRSPSALPSRPTKVEDATTFQSELKLTTREDEIQSELKHDASENNTKLPKRSPSALSSRTAREKQIQEFYKRPNVNTNNWLGQGKIRPQFKNPTIPDENDNRLNDYKPTIITRGRQPNSGYNQRTPRPEITSAMMVQHQTTPNKEKTTKIMECSDESSDSDSDSDSEGLDIEESEADEVYTILVKQLKELFPNALMCPKCKHGPVDFDDNAELAANHGKLVNGSMIDNSCKNCHYFSGRREDWIAWDEVIRQ